MSSNYSAVNARTYAKSNSGMAVRQNYVIKKVKNMLLILHVPTLRHIYLLIYRI